MDPHIVLEKARHHLASNDEPLVALWVVVPQNRDDFVTNVMAQRAALPVIAWAVRDIAFDEPNSILQDLLTSLAQKRDSLCNTDLSGDCSAAGRLCCILAARRELRMPTICSPVTLPDWFPFDGGKQSRARIEDISWQLDVPVAYPDIQTERIAALLFELEGALLSRMELVHSTDTRCTNALWDRIRRDGDSSFRDLLLKCTTARKSVTNPEHYRPSIRTGDSLIARMWGLSTKSSADSRPADGLALAKALQIPASAASDSRPSILSVLTRPSNRGGDIRGEWGRDVITTIGNACQLLTASAHADQYPQYPLTLLRSLSLDLRSALDSAVTVLENAAFEEVQ